MPTERLTIPTTRGYELSGALELPSGLVRGAAVFAHCFTCTKQSLAAVEVTRALAQHGIATLRFDFTGLGQSGGNFGRAGFASDLEDLIESTRYLADRFGKGLLLVGHSLGGAAVLAAADMLEEDTVAAIATIGAPAEVEHVLGTMKGDFAAIERDGEGEVDIGGHHYNLSRDFLEAVREVDLLAKVKALRIPLMFCHSPTDEIVDVDNAAQLFTAAKHPKSFISLAGADHLLTRSEDAGFAAGVIASWAHRYIPMREDWPMPEQGVVVKTGHGKFGTEVHTHSHRFLADEPTSYGGDDSGPTPYDLLNAALGTCSAMTMKMYADRKGWPLEGVTVTVTHERDHKDECNHVAAMEEGRQMQALHRRIELQGDALDEDQRARIIEIADKCPVHRTLEGVLHVHTKSVD
ncbi:alpha/beta fold hydrolase [Qipengyuania sp. YG27]|uniref:Alpha/beta fold hydrolase n=1 Tax=Qipengyuania mesophila TaxID=2867246 RepID=A0ABS7JYH7_9SPHN|nr:bifunctional alpha/beta hydrolase/OsmC family protein [Qipengyuania mesophila]MBX7502703.1 alpha/beta fold hydrolase [Qipengyuania mesophila]